MPNVLNMGVVPTYTALIAQYPSLSTALSDLPSGTRVYVEDQQCDVIRSSNGKFWNPPISMAGPQANSPANQVTLYGPAGANALSASAGQSRLIVRPSFYKMPGHRPATIKGFQIYLNTPGVVGGTTSGFDVRLYEAYPDGRPILGAAPLYVWSYNAAGSGTGATGLGTGTPGTCDFTTAGGTWFELSLPGGNRDVPSQFWMATKHDYTTTAPSLTTTAQNSFIMDSQPMLTPTDGTATVSKSQGHTWTEASFTLGEFAVFNASAEMVLTGLAAHCVLVDLAV